MAKSFTKAQEVAFAEEHYDDYGMIIFEDCFMNYELTIDLYTWHIGPTYQGMKLIPPGFHFLSIEPYFESNDNNTSNAFPVQSFCFFVHIGDTFVFQFNVDDETWSVQVNSSSPKVNNYRERSRQLDMKLATFPFSDIENLDKWKNLTSFIKLSTLKRPLPALSPSMFSFTACTVSQHTGKHDSLPSKSSKLDYFHFIQYNRKKFKSFDKSEALEHLLSHNYLNDFCELLGEFQLSVLIFTGGGNFDGIDRWLWIIALVCLSGSYISKHLKHLKLFLDILFIQLSLLPSDVISHFLDHDDNIIAYGLHNIYCILKDLPTSSSDSTSELLEISNKLFDFAENKLGWVIRTEYYAKDEAPTIV